jgi:hypothetical protein
MRQLKCPNCAAPVPASTDGSGITECEFCGTQFSSRPAPSAAPASGGARPVVALVVAGAVASLGVAAFAVISLAGMGAATVVSTAPVPPRQPPPVEKPAPKVEKKLAPSDLANLRLNGGWQAMEVPGFEAGSQTDVVAAVAAMVKAAREWSADVRIERLIIDGVTQDGELDLTVAGRDIDLRLTSPARRDAALALVVASDKEQQSMLRYLVEQGEVEVMATEIRVRELREGPPGPLEYACSPGDALAIWKERGLPLRPRYEVDVQWIASRGGYWRMGVSAEVDIEERLPYLSPTDCSVLER